MREDELKITRHNLSSIDFSDIEQLENETFSDKKAMARAIEAEGFYNVHFKKALKLFIQEQFKFMAEEATDEHKLAFSRGTINGFRLIMEWFEERIKLSQSRFETQEEDEPEGIEPI